MVQGRGNSYQHNDLLTLIWINTDTASCVTAKLKSTQEFIEFVFHFSRISELSKVIQLILIMTEYLVSTDEFMLRLLLGPQVDTDKG